MLDPEMIEDTIRITAEAIKDKIQVNLIINNRAGGNAPLIAQKIADMIHKEKYQKLFGFISDDKSNDLTGLSLSLFSL